MKIWICVLIQAPQKQDYDTFNLLSNRREKFLTAKVQGGRISNFLGKKYEMIRELSLNFYPVLRIGIEKMRMRIQEKISMRMRMRIHALTELWRPKYWYKKFLKGQSSEIFVPFLT
jgi:hypothetical protein